MSWCRVTRDVVGSRDRRALVVDYGLKTGRGAAQMLIEPLHPFCSSAAVVVITRRWRPPTLSLITETVIRPRTPPSTAYSKEHPCPRHTHQGLRLNVHTQFSG
eukprot:4379418-Prymnesium_polylepis.1